MAHRHKRITKPVRASDARIEAGTLDIDGRAAAAVDWLRAHGTEAGRLGMARYGIPSDRAFGVSVGAIQSLAKRMGKDHDLAAKLWDTGWYEARMLAAYVDEPQRVTPRQMDRWCAELDSWAICDTVCFALFDRTSHAWKKVQQWSAVEEEFVKRAAFALLWGLTVHDKNAGDERFLKALLLVEEAAEDERNFVKKGVNMALRAIGKRSLALNSAAIKVATRLAKSPNAAASWNGKNAVRELSSPAVVKRLSRRTGDAR